MNASGSFPVVAPPGTTAEKRERLFTAWVGALAAGEEPDRETFARVWRALAGVLRAELRRRGLWTAPPSFLGVAGWNHWGQEGARAGESGALDELTAACYEFTFVTRLRALAAQLQVRDNVDGLVFRNVRNFVHERQRECDPLGHLAWEVVHAAVEEAVAAGALHRVGGEEEIAGDSVLAVDPAADPEPPAAEEAARRRRALAALAAVWNADLLPDLVTARGGRQRAAVVAALARRLPEVAAEGVPALTFRALLDAVRGDLRERWAALFWQSRGGTLEAAETAAGDDEAAGFQRVLVLYRPPLPPEEEVAAREEGRALTECVGLEVEDDDGDERARSYLATLWGFVRTCVFSGEVTPSQRKLSQLLGIPRDRLPGLFERLGALLDRCRRLLRGAAAGKGDGG